MITKTYVYDAFGEEKDPDDTDTNRFRYCGEYYDIESGTIYLRARYYSAGTGRFTQEDPIKDGYNWYSYCGGNPVNCVDPSGLWSWEAFGKIALAAVVVVAVTALCVCTAGAAAVAIGASTAVATSVMASTAVGGIVAGAINIGKKVKNDEIDNIDVGELLVDVAIDTGFGAARGAANAITNPAISFVVGTTIACAEGLVAGAKEKKTGYDLYNSAQRSAGEYLIERTLGFVAAEAGLSEAVDLFDISPMVTTVITETVDAVAEQLVGKTIDPLRMANNDANLRKSSILQVSFE